MEDVGVSGYVNEKEFLLHFISLYRDLPQLWRLKSKDYMDKKKRSAAIKKIADLSKICRPNFTEEDVKKKINIIRTTFKREYGKIRKSRLAGSATNEVYVPSLWYYKELEFLEDQIEEESATNTIVEKQESLSPQPSTSIIQTTKKKRGDDLKKTESENQAIASNWAFKLERMSDDQRRLAEKIMNEVLFEAEDGNLHSNSVIINPTPTTPTEALLRKKWKYLRDQFAVEIAKAPPPPPPPSGVEAEDYYSEKSRWQYYGPLMFLKDVVKPRSIQGNSSKGAPPNTSIPIEVLVKEEFIDIDEIAVQNPLHSEGGGESEASDDELVNGGELNDSSSGNTNTEERIEERSKRRRVDEFNEESPGNNVRLKMHNPSERAASMKGAADEDDDDLLFFKSLLPHVRKIPDLKKLSFRSRVQGIVELFAYPQQ